MKTSLDPVLLNYFRYLHGPLSTLPTPSDFLQDFPPTSDHF